MSNDSNILLWTKQKRPTPNDVTPESIFFEIEQAQKTKAELIVDEIVGYAYKLIEDYNVQFDGGNEATLKQMALVVESLRAVLHGTMGYQHPLQAFSEQLFSITSESKNGPPIVIINREMTDKAEANNVANTV